MLTERQLEHVVAIAEAGTFTAAAERCHVGPSIRLKPPLPFRFRSHEGAS
jgi:hypothetical protein